METYFDDEAPSEEDPLDMSIEEESLEEGIKIAKRGALEEATKPVPALKKRSDTDIDKDDDLFYDEEDSGEYDQAELI